MSAHVGGSGTAGLRAHRLPPTGGTVAGAGDGVPQLGLLCEQAGGGVQGGALLRFSSVPLLPQPCVVSCRPH